SWQRCAAGSATRSTIGWSTRPAGSPGRWDVFFRRPGLSATSTRVFIFPPAGRRGGGANFRCPPAGPRGWEISTADFVTAEVLFPSGTVAGSSYDVHTIRAGLNYKLGSPAANAWAGNFDNASQTQFDNWEIHGQTTYIQQGYPAFHSPYLGVNSFTPWAQT